METFDLSNIKREENETEVNHAPIISYGRRTSLCSGHRKNGEIFDDDNGTMAAMQMGHITGMFYYYKK